MASTPRRRTALLTTVALVVAALTVATLARAAALATFTATPSLAAPHTVAFDATGSTGDGFAWNFGDGISAGQTATHTFKAGPAVREVSLTVQDSAGTADPADDTTDVETKAVTVPNAAPTRPSLVIETAGPFRTGEPVKFRAASTDGDEGDILAYAWDFGDGGDGAGANPSHTFTTAGDYDVEVVTRDNFGGVSASRSRTITVQGPPPPPPPDNRRPSINAMSASDGAPLIGQIVQFSATATDPDTSDRLTFSWDFGDGVQATGANPTHAYRTAGVRTVKLTVSDGNGGNDFNSLSITPRNPDKPGRNPSVEHLDDELQVDVNTPLRLQARASDPDNEPLTYVWDFGDGSTDVQPSPTHRWATPGIKMVTVIVRDPGGLVGFDVTNVVVRPKNLLPDADFEFFPEKPRVGQKVKFRSDSQDPDGGRLLHYWDRTADGKFGDPMGGRTSYVYKKARRYRVGLRVIDSRGGRDVVFKTIKVLPKPPPPRIDPEPKVLLGWIVRPAGLSLQGLAVRAPRGTRVSVTCVGKKCSFRSFVKVQRARYRTRLVSFPALRRFVRAGISIEVRATDRKRIGRYVRYRIRGSRRQPKLVDDRCLPPGGRKPMRCPR